MSEVKKRRPPTYYTIAKYIGQKCRSNAIARFDGTCGLPKCREWVSKYDAELVLQFTEALAINPKSEADRWVRINLKYFIRGETLLAIYVSVTLASLWRQPGVTLASLLASLLVSLWCHRVKHF